MFAYDSLPARLTRPLPIAMAFSLAFLLVISLATDAAASTLFVKTTGSGVACTQSQPCALQTAVSQGTDGDTLYLAAGTYTGSGVDLIELNLSVALLGGWTGQPTGPVLRDPVTHTTVLDGQHARRVAKIGSGAHVTLDGLILINGFTTGDGGALQVTFAGLTLTNCRVLGNFANSSGGGIYANNSDLVHLRGNEIADNEANTFAGGGVYIRNTPSALLIGNELIGNNANMGGGGIFLDNADHSLLVANTFQSNHTTSFGGGGLFVGGSDNILVLRNAVNENSAGQGAGIYLNNSREATLRLNTLSGNIATGSGGGVAVVVQSDAATLIGNTIIDNLAHSDGAGILLQDSVDATFINTILAGNHLAGLGGNGAGLFGAGAPGAAFWHTTVADNSGGNGQGIDLASGTTAVLTNTILVSHTIGIATGAGTTATLATTLWGAGAWANGVDTLGSGTVVTGTVNFWDIPGFLAPGLGDYHLAPGSSAIDLGLTTPIRSDVDFEPRPHLAFDLGADEWWPPGRLHNVYMPIVMRP